MATHPVLKENSSYVDRVRRFNRFYTRRIGLLQEELLQSPFSLTEVRVLYEIAHREKSTATELSNELGLDGGYLSRILGNFEKSGLVSRTPSATDARQSLLALTPRGQKIFSSLDRQQSAEVAAMLGKLHVSEQKHLASSMQRIEELLGES